MTTTQVASECVLIDALNIACTTTESVLAWHFVGPYLRDGRSVPPDGEILRQAGDIIPCENGLHGSIKIIDALQYAGASTICRTRHSGTIVYHDDKLASSERTILWRVDGDGLLRQFARQCALDVAHLWNMPAIVREYLETGDETKRRGAIRAAALAAAGAARDAAPPHGPPQGPHGTQLAPPHGPPQGPPQGPHGTHKTSAWNISLTKPMDDPLVVALRRQADWFAACGFLVAAAESELMALRRLEQLQPQTEDTEQCDT